MKSVKDVVVAELPQIATDQFKNPHELRIGQAALDELGRRAWAVFHAEAERGRFRRRVWFFTVDLADEAAYVMTLIFGPEPRTV